MKQLTFDELNRNGQFDYYDNDLLITDNLKKMSLDDYESVELRFIMIFLCAEGRMQLTMDGKEYRIEDGDSLIIFPGKIIKDVMLSQNADVKVLIFPGRAINESFYLNKYLWRINDFLLQSPLYHLPRKAMQTALYYHNLILMHGKELRGYGSFHQDVVRLLFQALMLEILMGNAERMEMESNSPTRLKEKNASAAQPSLIFKQFMQILGETGGKLRNVATIAGMINVSPRYLLKCVKDESGQSPLELIHEATIKTIKQQLRFTDKSIKEISNEMNFPNISFFGKFVKEHLGVSPKLYRKKHLQDG